MKNKAEQLEKLNKELNKRDVFQAVHALFMLCSLAAIPIGVLTGSQTVSLFGIAWMTSSFFSFSAESEKRNKQAIQVQIDFLTNISDVENELRAAELAKSRVSMGSINLN